MVDLRSDTVTRLTDEMRRAMAGAEVGDDGYGEDPTVRRLEGAFAERLGKEAALLVPSGTMANQLALRLLGQQGTAVVIGRSQHIVLFEAGAAAVNARCQLQLVDDLDGTISTDAVRQAVEGSDHHWLPASAVFVENTHLMSGGTTWPAGRLAEVAAFGLPVHLDGARLWNAIVATGETGEALAAPATTVMCCLTKGLAAPIGSLLAGPADLIAEARVERKRLGGAMRQAGVIAAAGIVAIEKMVDRLADDHARARALADALAERWPGCIDPGTVQTNIVIFDHPDTAALLDHLETEDVLAGTIAPGKVRLVTHLDVDDAGLERAIKALESAPPA